ncbi:hypothetical protein [Lutimonas vermicola]|uniref:Uncharacterized protein n=1 Tax=Lutimonas vermicola TaxID=414288 RepID=A0ABU9KZP5_9FLAO
MLSTLLESGLSYKPFIFNSSKGMYIFVKKKASFQNIEQILTAYFDEINLKNVTIHDTSFRPDFFRNRTRQILDSEQLSVLGWKKFISSFIMQIDPFNPSVESNSIEVFERFYNCVRLHGSKHQKKYLKRKLKILRQRVSLKPIENLLKFN